MDKTESLYLFEIKPPIVVESNCSLVAEAFNKVANPARLEWVREWEYCDMIIDLIMFAYS